MFPIGTTFLLMLIKRCGAAQWTLIDPLSMFPFSWSQSCLFFRWFALIDLLKLEPVKSDSLEAPNSCSTWEFSPITSWWSLVWWRNNTGPLEWGWCEKTASVRSWKMTNLETAYICLPHTASNSRPVCIFRGSQRIPLSLGLLCAVISTAWLLRSGHTQSFTVVSMLLGYLTSPLFSVWKSTVQ